MAVALMAAVGEHDRHAPLSDDSASFQVGGGRWQTGDGDLSPLSYDLRF